MRPKAIAAASDGNPFTTGGAEYPTLTIAMRAPIRQAYRFTQPMSRCAS